MLINFSNHPSELWESSQTVQAHAQFGEIVDIEFPAILPKASTAEIADLALKYVRRILEMKPNAVHIMGELSFTYQCVNLLKNYGVRCIVSTTERKSTVEGNEKVSQFQFVMYREY
jgi:NAD(P)H-flavin reductase